ncbi:extracellular solute-binding protein [Spiroplasma chrysopicola]|uniref:Spermidine/putrescine ABC transporter permease n=1 Tax=Spiroplasma chrysopicola DF-1 TaxID=1276227 RepID=R4U0E0_9MOLU|nr:extracellular solute-binding protein [Spiroplasma chrysopicola]AGM24697.1 spermidine/putrescine ABC transporter permease [Spiroplasma chrysopicola DF-1]
MKNFLKSSYMGIVMLFIYVPIMILILFSFNSGESMSIFNGFSDRWYKELAHQQAFLQSIIVSVFVAVIATIISTIIGTFAALGLSKARKVTQKMTLSITNIPLINADIITAVALMMLFIAMGANFGLLTLVLAHISFDIPFVIMTVLPRLRKIDQKLIEASLDLGAKPSQTLRKVILPVLKPAIIAAAAIAFAMSFDDFIISYFTGGADVNVATFIYTMKRIKPFINAFGTICIAIIGFVIIGWNGWNLYKLQHEKFRKEMLKGTYKDKDIMRYEIKLARWYHCLNRNTFKTEKQKEVLRWKIIRWENKYERAVLWVKNKRESFIERQQQKENISKISRKNFRWLAKSWKPLSLTLVTVGSIGLLTGVYIVNNTYDLIVANWGGYITPELLTNFQKEYNVKVKYTVYDSNETLDNKLYTTRYDVMVPSDYMVAKFAETNKIKPIDYEKLNAVNKEFNIIKPNSNFNGDITGYQIGNKLFNDKNIDIDVVKKANPEFYQQCVVNPNPEVAYCLNKNNVASLNNGLLSILNKNSVSVMEDLDNTSNNTIANYSLPYFWGDVSLLIRPTDSNLQFLQTIFDELNQKLPSTVTGQYGVTKQPWVDGRDQYVLNTVQYDEVETNGLSWDILWKAAQNKKKVLLNNDYRNIFMLANQKNYFSPIPTTKAQVDQNFQDLETLFKYNNVALMNDELINAVGDGEFDFAFMYNGDGIYADQLFAASGKEASNNKIMIVHPNATPTGKANQIEGTNIWSDNMVLSKSVGNEELAYKFMNYIIQNSNILSEELGYTSPYQQTMDFETNYGYYQNDVDPDSGEMINYQENYVPVGKLCTDEKISAGDCTIDQKGQYVSKPRLSDGPFTVTKLDQYMVDRYNVLIAGKN